MIDFKKIKVWEKSHKLVLKIYRVTTNFPESEKFGISSQLRRAALSIPTNIAEGSGRNSDPELKRFLNIAMGSAKEVEYLILLAFELNYIEENGYDSLHNSITEVQKMLAGFIKTILKANS